MQSKHNLIISSLRGSALKQVGEEPIFDYFNVNWRKYRIQNEVKISLILQKFSKKIILKSVINNTTSKFKTRIWIRNQANFFRK